MNDIEVIMQHAEQQCEARGARLTVRRKQVLAGLVQSDKALSAYELVDYCKEHYQESIPAMSVYRILDFLEKQHLAHKLKLSNKYLACARGGCDQALGETQFLVCEKCSKAKEISIDSAVIADLQETVQDAGFKLVNPRLEINCLCGDCATQTQDLTTWE